MAKKKSAKKAAKKAPKVVKLALDPIDQLIEDAPDPDSCNTCRFFQPDPRKDSLLGKCRRFPPLPGSQSQAITSKQAWCGEFQAA